MPASDDEKRARAWLEQTRRDAVLLLRDLLPVPFDAPGESYIGGLPKLPAHLDWPMSRNTSSAKPLTFMAQISVGDLPLFRGRELLPPQGTFYFFGEMWSAAPAERRGRVLFSNERIDQVAPRDRPEGLPPMCPTAWGYPGGWLPTRDFWRQVDFRYPVTAHRFLSYKKDPSNAEFSHEMNAISEELETAALVSALGEPIEILRKGYRDRCESCLTWPDWPMSWLHVRHAVDALDGFCRERLERDCARLESAELKPEAREAAERKIARRSEILAKLDVLGLLADEHEGLSAVPPGDAHLVVATIAEIEAEHDDVFAPFHVRKLVWRAIDFASKLCVAQGRDDLLPADYLDCLRELAGWRKTQYVKEGGLGLAFYNCVKHQLFGYSQNHQDEESVEFLGDRILLFQLDGEPTLALYPEPSGSYYFFISPKDLRAMNLDAVWFTGSMG